MFELNTQKLIQTVHKQKIDSSMQNRRLYTEIKPHRGLQSFHGKEAFVDINNNIHKKMVMLKNEDLRETKRMILGAYANKSMQIWKINTETSRMVVDESPFACHGYAHMWAVITCRCVVMRNKRQQRKRRKQASQSGPSTFHRC